ncbi:MAG: sodium:proton antiporter [Candidatus Krumholzibacteria bacterium]|nr:sodium:proton antiporter [Candidatus Krumholzibacteria bacterium]
MTLFDIAAILLGLSAVFGFINHRYLRLPHAIGLTIMGMVASITVVAIDLIFPYLQVGPLVSSALSRIDFYEALMLGMLSFLLFAGALHVDFSQLTSRKWSILLMATVGVLLSTFIVATLMWLALKLLNTPVPFVWALVFGALISPTDPVAVMGILKTVKLPATLEAKIAGESLFNDGVGVVVFTIVLAVATGDGHGDISPTAVARLFFVEAMGGALMGLAAGYIAYLAMRRLDEHNLEVIISLALVMVTYAVAHHLGISGPIAVVVAGIFIGNLGVKFAMSATTRSHLIAFWSLNDEILNSVLFLLIGLEVLVIRFDTGYIAAALLAIPVVLLARIVGVSLPIKLLSVRRQFTKGAIPVLVWGGLRGGISVALAFSLPENELKAPILTITYSVVVFSIVVQGLTVKVVATRMVGLPNE